MSDDVIRSLLVKFSLVQFKDLHLYSLWIMNERLCVLNKLDAVLVSWKLTYLVRTIFYELRNSCLLPKTVS